MNQNRSFDQTALRKGFSSGLNRMEIPYLSSLQKESYEKFLQLGVSPKERENTGIQSVFNSFFPVTDSAHKVTIEFLEYSLAKPKYSAQECLSAGRSFSAPLNAQLRIILWNEIEGSEKKEIRSIKEVFELRIFHGYAIDIGGEPIKSLPEAAKREREIIEFEHNLWSY